jgi:hypothetical protein
MLKWIADSEPPPIVGVMATDIQISQRMLTPTPPPHHNNAPRPPKGERERERESERERAPPSPSLPASAKKHDDTNDSAHSDDHDPGDEHRNRARVQPAAARPPPRCPRSSPLALPCREMRRVMRRVLARHMMINPIEQPVRASHDGSLYVTLLTRAPRCPPPLCAPSRPCCRCHDAEYANPIPLKSKDETTCGD